MSGVWGAGLIGADGTDYVAEQADEIRKRMGRGLYSQDPHGAMGQWRDLVAIPLALLRSFLDYIERNANPGTAEDCLQEWESYLRIGQNDGTHLATIQQRQQRVEEHLRRWVALDTDPDKSMPEDAGYPTEWTLWRLFYAIHKRALGVGPVSFVWDAGPPSATWTLTVQPQMYYPGNLFWLRQIEAVRDLLCPVGGWITITA